MIKNEKEFLVRLNHQFDRKIKLISKYTAMTKTADFICNKGHEWTGSPSELLKKKQCYKCYLNNHANRMSTEAFDKKLSTNYTRLSPYVALTKVLTMKCSMHGKYHCTGTQAIKKLGGCYKCIKSNAKTARKPKEQECYNRQVAIGTKNTIKVLGDYINANTKIDHQCSCGRTWKVSPKSMLQSFGTCKECVVHRKHKYDTYGYVDKEIEGRKFRVQGYEGEALVLLSKRNINMLKVIVHSKNIPKFTFIHNKKRYRYYPDFYYKDNNTIYEVKSSYTMGIKDIKTFIINKKKAKCVISKGYNFRLILSGIRKIPPIILPNIWINMKYREFFDWLEECYGITKTKTHGVCS